MKLSSDACREKAFAVTHFSTMGLLTISQKSEKVTTKLSSIHAFGIEKDVKGPCLGSFVDVNGIYLLLTTLFGSNGNNPHIRKPLTNVSFLTHDSTTVFSRVSKCFYVKLAW